MAQGIEENGAPVAKSRRRRWWLAIGATVLFAGVVAADWWFCVPADLQAQYVGTNTCTTCHQDQSDKWQGSHHQLAMQAADESTVLGNFDNATVEHHGITSRLFRRDGKYMINTEGPDGKMADFEIKYTFGVEPLQQYMVEFDRPADMPENEIARLQVLRVSWDTGKKEWFYLPAPDVEEKLEPDDELHWTGITQRWNASCAECHSTNLKKGFDHTEGIYHTTFSEISVGCESCHGPGSVHVRLANAKSLFWDRKRGYGLARLKTKDNTPQIEACAPCHSRRGVVHPEYHAGGSYHDFFTNEFLSPVTYHADGQVKEEDYVYGSFLQSKMYHKGIRCSDCHDPHTTKLKSPGNSVCTTCHAHPKAKYDTPAHHGHKEGSTGTSCADCHMPETTYMAVDPRRDHSLRIPRPDLSVSLGTPNACTQCHLDRAKITDKTEAKLKQYQDWIRVAKEGNEEVATELKKIDAWAAAAVRKWYKHGPEKYDPHFAEAFHAAWENQPDGGQKLLDVIRSRKFSAMARASALYYMRTYLTETKRFNKVNEKNDSGETTLEIASRRAAIEALKDADPLVRRAGVLFLSGEPPDDRLRHLLPLLEDPTRVVRMEAMSGLIGVPRELLGKKAQDTFDTVFEEFKESLSFNNDRGAPHAVMGSAYEQMQQFAKARRAYETAIRVEPRFANVRTTLAALLDRQAGMKQQQIMQAMQKGGGENTRELAEDMQKLQLYAAKLRQQELALLARDAKLAPDNWALQYRYGLSLYLNGQYEEAEQALLKAYYKQEDSVEIVQTLTLFYQKLQQYGQALDYAQRLKRLRNDQVTEAIIRQLRIQAARSPDRAP